MQKDSSPNITQKEAFLKYLQRMDIEMLELILDDSVTYFGASKKVFLEKLSFIFNEFKLVGGKGDLKIKHHKNKPNTCYLLLQLFCYAIKFIIEEKDGEIIKMCGNGNKTSKVDIENLNTYEIFFGDDEKADFIPSTEYIMTLHRCTKAYEELYNDKIQILSSEDVSIWIKRHTLLYEEVKEEFLLFKYNDFRTLFFILEFIMEGLQNVNEVRKALNSFNDSNTTSLYQWLVEYNRLAFCKLVSYENFFSDINAAKKTLKYRFQSNIYFTGDDFLAIIKFNELYYKYLPEFSKETII